MYMSRKDPNHLSDKFIQIFAREAISSALLWKKIQGEFHLPETIVEGNTEKP